jgi:O-antigen/teichoic acid export membrane protein
MNNSSIEYRAFKNTSVGVLSFLVTLCQTIVLVPILLRYWGNASYGLWLTLMAGFNLLQTLDLGHQNYIGNQLNVQYHSDIQQFRSTLGSSLLIAYFLGFVEIGICALLIASGSITYILSVSSTVIAEHQLSLGLMLLMTMWLVFGSVGGIIVRIMIPAGMLYESQWLGMVVRLTQFLSIIIVAVSGGNILAACLWYAVLQSGMSLLIFRYIKIKLPQFYPWWHGAQWREGLISLRKSLVLTFNSIGQQLSNNGLVILISVLFTSAVIPLFTTLRTLTNTAGAVTTIFITALFPDMIRFHATRESGKLTGVFNANWFISGICVNFGIILVLPIIETIYRFWTKGYLAFNPDLFFLLAVAISLANFGAGLSLYLAGINDLRSQTFITITRAGVLFLASYLLSSYCGILSIGIGCVLAEVLASVVLPVVFVNRRLSGFSAQLSLKHVGLAIMPPALLLLAGGVIMAHHVSFSLVMMVLLPVLCAIYYANWKILGGDVQGRISSLASSVIGKLSFGL